MHSITTQKLFAVAFFVSFSTVSARQFTVKKTARILPAIFTDPNVGQSKPAQPTGWEAPAGNTVTFQVPDDWAAGRIWLFVVLSHKPAVSACSAGSCNGGLECAAAGGTGVPPVTVAEWTLGKNGSPDNYDVSVVDGFNIPMSVVPTGGCPQASCPVDLNPGCPAPLQLAGPGGIAGCKSACSANLDGNAADSPNCCSGSHNVPETCPPSGVQFYDYFKKPCVNAYAYAYDESSKTALWTCDSGLKADYVVTFCP
ncbi:thaumatin [Mycena rebaudengoi]|nr:thaumatin [Mycena rebaudengoi]